HRVRGVSDELRPNGRAAPHQRRGKPGLGLVLCGGAVHPRAVDTGAATTSSFADSGDVEHTEVSTLLLLAERAQGDVCSRLARLPLMRPTLASPNLSRTPARVFPLPTRFCVEMRVFTYLGPDLFQ